MYRANNIQTNVTKFALIINNYLQFETKLSIMKKNLY